MKEEWEKVILFYQKLEDESWKRSFASMKELVEVILEKYDLKEFHPFTSHATLYISKYIYPERYDKSMIQIFSVVPRYYELSLIQPIKEGVMLRKKIETLVCPISQVPIAFEELFNKFLKLV